MRLAMRTVVLFVSLFTLTTAYAVPITIVSQQDVWSYNQATGLGSGLIGGGFATFTSGYTGTSTGNAAFGNSGLGGAPLYTTLWDANTALYLQKTVNLDGIITGNATLNVAVDNGAAIFINGTQVFNADAGGFTSIWEYTASVSDSLFINGLNTISVIANDYGGATYFDMQLLANIEAATANVPAPATFMLMLSGTIALLSFRRQGS
ncbi:MAG: hypothetical protein GKR93_16285 [Gammaproteobacteria bacterium]|nr:hypothetical protein [Gammaproteobacteria bacterium]